MGFVAYLALVVRLGDHVARWHWAPQSLFYAVAGVAWVWPATWLVRWAARGAPPKGG